jgi:hypothetical protein
VSIIVVVVGGLESEIEIVEQIECDGPAEQTPHTLLVFKNDQIRLGYFFEFFDKPKLFFAHLCSDTIYNIMASQVACCFAPVHPRNDNFENCSLS